MFKQELEAYEREAYEDYIKEIINDPSDKNALTKALSKLVQGSNLYDFLYLITEQKFENGKASANIKKLLLKIE